MSRGRGRGERMRGDIKNTIKKKKGKRKKRERRVKETNALWENEPRVCNIISIHKM